MAISYPADLPAPSLEGFSYSISMGVIRAGGPTDQVQRRVYSTMPHTFTLTFVMGVDLWATWTQWVMANAYNWFLMSLPTAYAGLAGEELSPVLIRFTSGIQASNVVAGAVQLAVVAEMSPSMISQYLAAV